MRLIRKLLRPRGRPSARLDDPEALESELPLPSPRLRATQRSRPAVRVYDDSDGLPQNGVSALAFDARGYLWVGTEDGAARYDGRTWRAVDMPNRTRSNRVFAALAASDGSLSFGTWGGGVARLIDAGRGEWTTIDTANGLPSNQVRALAETRSQSGAPILWVGTEGGLARVEGDVSTVYDASSGLPGNRIRCLLATRGDGAVLTGTTTGLARLSSRT